MRSAADAAGTRDRPCALLELGQAPPADRFDDGVLGGEEPIDVGRRHLEFRGNVGDRCLGKAQPPEQPIGRIHDAVAGIVWLGLRQGVHGTSPGLCDE